MSEAQSADVGRVADFVGSADGTGAFTSRRNQTQATSSTMPTTIAVA